MKKPFAQRMVDLLLRLCALDEASLQKAEAEWAARQGRRGAKREPGK